MDIPSAEPAELIVGDTWRWTRAWSDFPAGTWTLSYSFKNSAGAFAVAGAEITASGTEFAVSVPAATTTTRAAGRYAWAAFVTSGADRYQVAEGEAVLRPNLAAAGALDTRTPARRMLDAIEAYLTDSNNLAAARYQIGNRSLDRWNMDDLLKMRSKLKFEVAAEAAAAGGPNVRRSYVRFNRA